MCIQFTEDSRIMPKNVNIKTVSGVVTDESSQLFPKIFFLEKQVLVVFVYASVILAICIGNLWGCLCDARVSTGMSPDVWIKLLSCSKEPLTLRKVLYLET